MQSIYPFASGSLYTASYAISGAYAISASLINFVFSASKAGKVLFPESGSRGIDVCLLTTEQYLLISGSSTKVEVCDFSE